MPGSIIGELILRPVLEFLFHVIAYYIGLIFVPVISLGYLKCDRISSDTSNRKLHWGGTYYRLGKQIYLTCEATAICGVLIVLIPTIGWFLVRHFSTKT